eukprot:m.19815 g.19815  ORF g.19815 m.19815 type:complete len:602 (-) comp12324_c0_seq1:24-1829(-)
MSEPPIPTLAVRGSEGVQCLRGPPDFLPGTLPSDPANNCRVIAFSRDGSLFAWCNAKSVEVVELDTNKKILSIPKPRTIELVFSPLNTFLCTWETYQVKPGEKGSPNLNIWNLTTGEHALGFIAKRHADWAPHWTETESLLAHAVASGIHFYDGQDFSKGVIEKLPLQNVSAFALSPGTGPCKVAAFVPGSKGGPAAVRVFQRGKWATPALSKSFFKADRVTISWNRQGTALLISTQTDVDNTGQSYYGETNLYFLSLKNDISVIVPLDKEGPIYDFAWHPNGKEFAVVFGFMPAKALLFNYRCEKSFDFGTGKRNTVKFSPSGNVLVIAGFGNLRGDMEFWAHKTLSLVNTIRAPDSTMYSWCPDSRHMLTATTSPRLKVDNGFKVWHYMNGLIKHVPVKELWDAKWRSALPGTYPGRPISPQTQRAKQESLELAKPQVYRPPGARGAPSLVKLHAEEEKPDDPVMSATALKNKRRREARARKQAKQQSSTAKNDQGGDTNSSNKSSSKSKSKSKSPAADEPAPSSAAPQTPQSSTPGDDATDISKRIRNLKKKLRQIEGLKEKQAAGEFLQSNQLNKVQSEPAVHAEIAQLEKELAKQK